MATSAWKIGGKRIFPVILFLLPFLVIAASRGTRERGTKQVTTRGEVEGRKISGINGRDWFKAPMEYPVLSKFDWDDEDQVRNVLEVVNYVIWGLPASWIVLYVIVYGYTYFFVFTTKWVLDELNRGGDLNHPVNYQKWDASSPLSSEPSLQHFVNGLMSVMKPDPHQQNPGVYQHEEMMSPGSNPVTKYLINKQIPENQQKKTEEGVKNIFLPGYNSLYQKKYLEPSEHLQHLRPSQRSLRA